MSSVLMFLPRATADSRQHTSLPALITRHTVTAGPSVSVTSHIVSIAASVLVITCVGVGPPRAADGNCHLSSAASIRRRGPRAGRVLRERMRDPRLAEEVVEPPEQHSATRIAKGVDAAGRLAGTPPAAE